MEEVPPLQHAYPDEAELKIPTNMRGGLPCKGWEIRRHEHKPEWQHSRPSTLESKNKLSLLVPSQLTLLIDLRATRVGAQ